MYFGTHETMRINVEVDWRAVEPAIDWMGGLIGAAVDKRVAAFERQERKNPLLATYFRENYALEYALAKARKYRRTTGRLPKTEEYTKLYGFAVPAYRIHTALPAHTRTPFEGRLRDAVKGAYGTRPFAYEISIATHLMLKGWDVEFADYGRTAQFDFLANKDQVEIEVECKTSSGDTGRKVHRQEVNRLADRIGPAAELLAEIRGCHFIRITLPDRLGTSEGEHARIASTVIEVARGRASAATDFAAIDYTYENPPSWHEPESEQDVRDSFETKLGITNAHIRYHCRPGHALVVIAITSAKADSVVAALSTQAKEAADQCSGTRPALIALHLIDEISSSDLAVMLHTPNGLHAIAGSVFKGEKRLHVDSVAFTVPQHRRTDNIGSIQLSGQVIVLNNPCPQYPCDALRSIFR
jgi:hypothetical protein